jgi:PAS domain S-box-containing protein
MLVMVQDITERVAARAHARTAEAKLESLLRVAPAGIGIVAAGRITWVNSRAEQLAGYGGGKLTGRDAVVLFRDAEGLPETAGGKGPAVRLDEPGSRETRWRKKDGGLVDVLVSWTPMGDQDLADAAVFTALDITERRDVERRLSRSERRLSALLDGILDGHVLIDGGGTVVSANRAMERLLGYRPDELTGQNVALLMGEPHRSRHHQYLRRLVETGESRILGQGRPVEGRHRDGRRVRLHIAVTELVIDGERMFSALMRPPAGPGGH